MHELAPWPPRYNRSRALANISFGSEADTTLTATLAEKATLGLFKLMNETTQVCR
jgi:hypothetical protein